VPPNAATPEEALPDPAWAVLQGDSGEQPAAFSCDLPDGRSISVSKRPVAGGGWVATYEDTTHRRQAEARVAHMAHHDALTGLANRVLFREHMQHALARAKRNGRVALLCLDLDHFKSVNDTLGHPIGDALLCEVASRLRQCTRETDLVVRLGGDEFAIVQEGPTQPNNAEALARRLIDALAEPFDINSHQLIVGTSIGIALSDVGTDDTDILLKCADLALYRAKSDGRGTWRFFEPEMDAVAQARRALELDLRQALAGGQFELFYQPLLEANGARISGFEALIRWRHPKRGMVNPALFIPLAEEVGLISSIGSWVLRQACADAVRWPGQLKVAVNLSPAQFRNGMLAREVEEALLGSGLDPKRLELEITENVLLQDHEIVLETLHAVRSKGVRIAMDDFGTGYSSLSYLRRFPFDKIKIDQSFVRGLGDDEEAAAIVRAVAGLGRTLGMAVNAEGVETAEQLAALQALGCGEVQGYLFSPPRPTSEISELLRQYGIASRSPGAIGCVAASTNQAAPHSTLLA
ncbi:putative bifunctional diguanylate cyclase/phosphodiesterase, partial [Paracraurococcus lichenis]